MYWVLPLLAVLPFYGAWHFDFVSFDDPQYVYDNPWVNTGLTRESLAWAFSSGHASNWHPLTWISHMIDVQWFGLDAGKHHAVNILIHALNALLLYVVLSGATGQAGRSALVAALFAVHPLHVESVAWISERKDVLSTLFMLLTMWAYLQYVNHRGLVRYALVFVFLALGLMAKPMLVTLPFVLLLLDGWPLNRFQFHSPEVRILGRLALEKMPLFALVLVSSIVTLLVQTEGGAVAASDAVSLAARLSNACVSYVTYIGKTLIPGGLAVLYPYPAFISAWKVAACLALLAAISFGAWKTRGKYPYLLLGWFWYLGTLVPVIGIVQVGSQAMADRYTYIPLIGLFIALAWGGFDLLVRPAKKRLPVFAMVFLAVAALTATSYLQARHWENAATLWARAVAVTTANYRAHTAYGALLAQSGATEQAMYHFERALNANPDHVEALNKLGALLSDMGRFNAAIPYYKRVLDARGDHPEANLNMGNALAASGQPSEALGFYHRAIESRPGYILAMNGLGSALDDLGRVDEAIETYLDAIELDPDVAAVHSNLSAAYYKLGDIRDAHAHSETVLQLEPDNAAYQTNHAIMKIMMTDFATARTHLARALELSPGYQPALDVLGMLPPVGE